MATTTEGAIQEVLFARLASLVLTPVHPVAWPNVTFTPPTGNRYLEALFMPNAVNRLLIDSDGRGGLHIWVLFAVPAPTADVEALLQWAIRDWKRFVGEQPECFPKQGGVTEKNPFGNVFEVASELLENEAEAARNADGATGRYWKVINPNITNAVGNHPGYKVVVMPSPTLLADPASSVAKRAGFAQKHIWVTPYAPEERFASGDYPNQHGGECGLPVYIRQKRSIVNQDIVLWHSFGHTHVCKPEDFPIMPVEYAGFTLKPNNFFMTSPAMTIPPAGKSHHASSEGGTACCHGPSDTQK